MKRNTAIVMAAVIAALSGFFAVQALQESSARAAVVMDVNSNRILYSKNMDEKMAMASTTKIMTTLVAIESGRLDEKVTISKRASYMEGSSIYLREGEVHTVNDLLYAIMLRSGNDAATAVAEHIGGSAEGFAEMMNKKAREIGANNTRFANPHGLDAEGHYTTARDLALITSYALKNPLFSTIVSSKKKVMEGPPSENWDRIMINKNKMLWQFDGGDGVKTGFTKKAGRCLVSSATREGMRLVCVVLNCGPMWDESSALLEYAFKNYVKKRIVDKDSIFKVVEVRNGKERFVGVKPAEDFDLVLRTDRVENIKLEAKDLKAAQAPLKKGGHAGRLEIYIDNNLLKTINLEYSEGVESSSPFYYLKRILTDYIADAKQ
ncbi:MAG TPA: D-alanyl-D-alanine carboxypeptidase family protein [Bacillota bacterium]|nr:D-alanyl-D-alanine carboxypeptidase family protein [Bacillota bacterium]HQQ44080.1 D-alanyl-D-alanine carboxypeptidase family protein [Bacillota bacterium]